MIIINYLLYYGLILPVSLLPFPVLYFISDGLFLLLYYVIGYRKKVVMQNINSAFADKTEAERKIICKEFYRHLCDLVVESLKLFTITHEEAQQRMDCLNPELVNSYYQKNQSVILAGGHLNNWEMFAVVIQSHIQHHPIAIYKALNSKFFDEKMRSTRSKFGLKMIPTYIVKKLLADGIIECFAMIFAYDQSPSNPQKAYWTKFLNRDTAWLKGCEDSAREYNLPVLYGRIHKVKRGHYTYDFTVACEQPIQTSPGEITQTLSNLLETDILNQPAYWLWSHRRWKHKR